MPIPPTTPARRTAPAARPVQTGQPLAAAGVGHIWHAQQRQLDTLAAQVRALRVAQLRARQSALATRTAELNRQRRASLRARRAALTARVLPGRTATPVKPGRVKVTPVRRGR